MVKIGDIKLGSFPLLLAPMEDVSDPPFRALWKEQGADVVGLNCFRGPATMLPYIKEIRKELKCHVAALPVPYRTTEEHPTFFNLPDNNGCGCPSPHGRTFPTALDPLLCNRYEIGNFAKEVFSKITLALPSNLETLKCLKLMKVKNIKVAGNLKYYGEKNLEKINSKDLKSKFKNFKTWCAASTHKSEEIFLGKLHKKLKKFNKRIITIIIPRHINRSSEIINDMNKLGLKTIAHTSNQKLKIDTDIYLVDSYGISSKFYSLTNVAFVGGSLIAHGGQNPLEPARFGNFIINLKI